MSTAKRFRFSELRADSLVDQIRDELQRAVLSGALEQGTAMRDSVIAAEMGVSRAPVREALRGLQESGLVQKLPNRSYRVASFSTEDWHDLAYIRIAYEVLAVRLAVARSATSEKLAQAEAKIRAAVVGNDDLETIAADWAFHEAIVRSSGSAKLLQAYSHLRGQIQLALITNVKAGSGHMEGIAERHAELLALFEKAVGAGQPGVLVPVLEEHICVGMGTPVLPS